MRYAASKRNITAVVGAAFATGAVVVMMAGCSGSGGESKNASGSGAQDYVACLRSHGVTITMPSFDASRRPSGSRGPMPDGARPSGGPGAPDGGFSDGGAPGGSGAPGGRAGGGMFGSQAPEGVDQQEWTKAQQACASLRPSFGPREGDSGGNGGGNSGGAGGGADAAYRNCLSEHGVTTPAGSTPDATDASVQAAQRACAPLRPSATTS